MRRSHWAPRHRLGGSSELPPKSLGSLPLTVQSPVHEPYGATESRRPSFALDNQNAFRVAWNGGAYPTATAKCSTSAPSTTSSAATATTCAVHGTTCV